ncbi:uncharacterized protein EV422DRAFT_506772 [Fimicolochytrium jonesii]|uniref:uncharacterized protein n=1 Tax=Fimicolochytrium jonesii TaxID=1396493 RepID=UPI0022FE9B7F|nr:uncharacterized protein EV422DRAFT_506772 [Fimicolochytrium jonesii]KAI8820536.1 hypothetical protein EV422DRAFT_506772 [Fimicolochytrium jonesii]
MSSKFAAHVESKPIRDIYHFKESYFGGVPEFNWTLEEYEKKHMEHKWLTENFTKLGANDKIKLFVDFDMRFEEESDLPSEEVETEIRKGVDKVFTSLYLNEDITFHSAFRTMGYAPKHTKDKNGKYVETGGGYKVSYRLWADGMYTTRNEMKKKLKKFIPDLSDFPDVVRDYNFKDGVFDLSVYDNNRSMVMVDKVKNRWDNRLLIKSEPDAPISSYIIQYVEADWTPVEWTIQSDSRKRPANDEFVLVPDSDLEDQPQPKKKKAKYPIDNDANTEVISTIYDSVTKLCGKTEYLERDFGAVQKYEDAIVVFLRTTYCMLHHAEHDVSVPKIFFIVDRKKFTFKCQHCERSKTYGHKSKKILDLFPPPITEPAKTSEEKDTVVTCEDLEGLTGWEKFDFRRILNISHKNTAEWFIEERGKDNIWRKYEGRVRNSDLNLQIADTLISSFEKLLDDFDSQRSDHAQNVERLCTANDTCIELFLSKPHLFAFNDKVYDLIEGEARSIKWDDYILFTCGYNYPTTRSPEMREKIENFYQSIFRTEELMTYRLCNVARCLYGELVEEIFTILKGPGRNGKGVEGTLLAVTFGNYFYTLDKKNFTREQQDVDKANSQLYNCFGKRYLMTSETNKNDRFLSEMFKKVSGNDKITVRTLNGKPISFPITGQTNVQTNEDPVFDKIDLALCNRVRMQEFPYSFTLNGSEPIKEEGDGIQEEQLQKEGDMKLKGYFKTNACRDEFILLLIGIFRKRFVKEDKTLNMSIEVPAEVRAFTQKNLANSLAAAKWLKFHYDITGSDDDRVTRSDLYKEYSVTVLDQSRRVGKQQFFKELTTIQIKERKIRGNIWFLGLKKATREGEMYIE